jgi:hypothetical protein
MRLIALGLTATLLSSCSPWLPPPVISGPAGQPGIDGAAGATGPQGPTGANGLDAPPTPYTPTALLNPCGDAPGVADEVLLQLEKELE